MMHQPFIGERFSGDSVRRITMGPSGVRETGGAALRVAERATAFTTSPLLMNAADRAAFGRAKTRCGSRAMAATAIRIACSPPDILDLVSRPS